MSTKSSSAGYQPEVGYIMWRIYVWNSLKLRGAPWISMELRGDRWVSVELHGNETPWNIPRENSTEDSTELPVKFRFMEVHGTLVEIFIELTVEFSMGYFAAKSVENDYLSTSDCLLLLLGNNSPSFTYQFHIIPT